MQVILHSHLFHYFIVFLVVLDALIVLFELLLDVGAFGESSTTHVRKMRTLCQGQIECSSLGRGGKGVGEQSLLGCEMSLSAGPC